MALTSSQINKLSLEVILGKPSGIVGAEADEFREKLKKEIEDIKAQGYEVELPSDPE